MSEKSEQEIAKLAAFILDKIDGRPSGDESAVDCAIRILNIQQKIVEGQDHLLKQQKKSIENLREVQRLRKKQFSKSVGGITLGDIPNYEETPKWIYATFALTTAVHLSDGDQEKALSMLSTFSKQVEDNLDKIMPDDCPPVIDISKNKIH